MAFLGHKRVICSFSFLALMAMHVFGADPEVTYALVDASDPTKGATTTFEISSAAGFASAEQNRMSPDSFFTGFRSHATPPRRSFRRPN